MSPAQLERIGAERKLLWANGYPPVAVLAHTDPDPKKAGKAPLRRHWVADARQDPPADARASRALDIATNTGLAAHGMRIIDVDCGDRVRAERIEATAVEHFGPTIKRFRANSSRFALLYRAAEGEPRKVTLKGTTHSDDPDNPDKVEVLGAGQQLAALGTHISGAPLEWSPLSPLEMPRDQLPAITEEQIAEFFVAIAPIIGAKPPRAKKTPTTAPVTKRGNGEDVSADLVRVETVLLQFVPADDYEVWVLCGMALRHETEGTDQADTAFTIWNGWSATSGKYDSDEIQGKWNSFEGTPDNARPVGFGTIYEIAKRHGYVPSAFSAPGYQASLDAEAKLQAGRGANTSTAAALQSQPQPQPGAGEAPPPPSSPGPTPAPSPPRPRRQPPLPIITVEEAVEAERQSPGRTDAEPTQVKGPPPPPPPASTIIIGPQPAAGPPANIIEELNRTYAVVNEAGKVLVFAIRHDTDLGWPVYDRMSFADFKRLHDNRKVQVGAEWVPLGSHWLKHPNRKQYPKGTVFDPHGEHSDAQVLNLWDGFRVQPCQGASWEKIQDHIRDILCGGVAHIFDWVMDWCANVVQHPELQGNVVIVLVGPEGAGKSVLSDLLHRMLGRHAVLITNPHHLTGKFNAHFQYTTFAGLDEAPDVGIRVEAGVLRSMATAEFLSIEPKFGNVFQSRNRLHIAICSNKDFVIPAGLDSRRWLVLKVLEDWVENIPYFAAIYAQLDNDTCIAAALHDLLNRKINSNQRVAPVTVALKEMRKHSFGSLHRWWHHVLARGFVWESQFGLSDYFDGWREHEPTALLYRSYERFCREHRLQDRLSLEYFGREFRKLVARAVRLPAGGSAVGEEITDVPVDPADPKSRTTRKGVLIERERPRGYEFGSLEAARAGFADATGLDFDWDDDP